MQFPEVSWPQFDEREAATVLAALQSGKWWRNEGTWVAQFEGLFAQLEAAPHVIGVTNGTHALELALLAAGVGSDHGVLVPAITFYSSLSAVQRSGAVPLLVDVDLDTWSMRFPLGDLPTTVAATALLPVHYGGMPADMPHLATEATSRGLALIQDAAHGPGIRIGAQSLAEFGGTVCYSFQHSKLLPSGEGGAVVFADEDVYQRSLLLQNCGRAPGDSRYSHSQVSSNFRMPELTGALLCAQLEKFAALAEQRARGAALLRERLAAIEGLKLQATPSFASSTSNYLIQARIDLDGVGADSRDQFVAALQRHGVPVNRAYAPLFELEAYWKTPEPGVTLRDLQDRCPNAATIGATGISLHHRILLLPASDLLQLGDLIDTTLHALREPS